MVYHKKQGLLLLGLAALNGACFVQQMPMSSAAAQSPALMSPNPNGPAPMVNTTPATSHAATQVDDDNDVQAQNNNLSTKCGSEGIGVNSNNLVLNADNKSLQRVFILHNPTNQMVILSRVNAYPSGTASAGWATKLNPRHWAAIAINQPNFAFSCISYSPPVIGAINCQSVISACSYPLTNTVGSLWVTQDVDKERLIEVLQQRNLLP